MVLAEVFKHGKEHVVGLGLDSSSPFTMGLKGTVGLDTCLAQGPNELIKQFTVAALQETTKAGIKPQLILNALKKLRSNAVVKMSVKNRRECKVNEFPGCARVSLRVTPELCGLGLGEAAPAKALQLQMSWSGQPKAICSGEQCCPGKQAFRWGRGRAWSMTLPRVLEARSPEQVYNKARWTHGIEDTAWNSCSALIN